MEPHIQEVASDVFFAEGSHTNFMVPVDGGEATAIDTGYPRDAPACCGGTAPAGRPRCAATHAAVAGLVRKGIPSVETCEDEVLLPGHGDPWKGSPRQGVEIARTHS